jgi:hypothetical protein
MVLKLVYFVRFNWFSSLSRSSDMSLKVSHWQTSIRHQNPSCKHWVHAFSSYNEGLGSCWMNLLWLWKVTQLCEVTIRLGMYRARASRSRLVSVSVSAVWVSVTSGSDSLSRGLGRPGSLGLGHYVLGWPKSILNLTDTVSDRDRPTPRQTEVEMTETETGRDRPRPRPRPRPRVSFWSRAR